LRAKYLFAMRRMTMGRPQPRGGGLNWKSKFLDTPRREPLRDKAALAVIPMTPKQRLYVERRAAGMGQERAALEAGYAKGSAKVSASRMERDPAIRKAIDDAREAARGGPGEPRQYEDPESYLSAVVAGAEPPDPVRVGAARALLPFFAPRRRATKKSAAPRDLQGMEAATAEGNRRDAWDEKAARVRARFRRKK
jgi:hypothetical protein